MIHDISRVSATAGDIEKTLNAVWLAALRCGAAEILIEPRAAAGGADGQVLVRFRVDGGLKDGPFTLPWAGREPLLRKLKAMSETMDPLNTKNAQAGQLELAYDGKNVPMSIKTQPGESGESCVMTFDPAALPARESPPGLADSLVTMLESKLADPKWDEADWTGKEAARSGQPDADKRVFEWAKRTATRETRETALQFLAGYWGQTVEVHVPTVLALIEECESHPLESLVKGPIWSLQALFRSQRNPLAEPERGRLRALMSRYVSELERAEAERVPPKPGSLEAENELVMGGSRFKRILDDLKPLLGA